MLTQALSRSQNSEKSSDGNINLILCVEHNFFRDGLDAMHQKSKVVVDGSVDHEIILSF